MKFASFTPKRIMTWLALVLISAVSIEFIGNSYLNTLQEREIVSKERIRYFTQQLVNADHIASREPPARRPLLMADMAIQGMTLNWVPRTVITDASDVHEHLLDIRGQMIAAAPSLSDRELRLTILPSENGSQRDLLGALRLADGSFITLRIHPFLGAPPSFATNAMRQLAFVALLLVAALLTTWALVRPLDKLADAADATNRDHWPEIPIQGPEEVRRVATAFRSMQQRLQTTMDDHHQAMMALSHDLRTPIQRLRLRTSLPIDDEVRVSMKRDLEEMENFITSVVDFLRSGLTEEDKLVDLAALAMSIVDDASDAGFDIEYDGPDAAPVWLKPLSMKRALRNLVDNACRHADHVVVTLEQGPHLTIRVEDDGPGIAPDRRAEAFEPFRRFDDHESTGSGLGLAIVKNVVSACKGTVTLEGSSMGGLAAKIVLPQASA